MPTVTSDGGPARLDIVVHQGADWRKTFTILDGAGNPVDLTGYAAALEVGRPGQPAAVRLESGDGITLGGAAGTVAVVIPAADTAGLAADARAVADRDQYGWDLLLTSPGGAVSCPLTGQVAVQRGYAGVADG